jgi:hypothetical protein
MPERGVLKQHICDTRVRGGFDVAKRHVVSNCQCFPFIGAEAFVVDECAPRGAVILYADRLAVRPCAVTPDSLRCEQGVCPTGPGGQCSVR